MPVPIVATIHRVELTGELSDERSEYPGETVLMVDSPIEHSGIWPVFDDRKPTGWRVVGPITEVQARYLIRQAARGWRIGWTLNDLAENGLDAHFTAGAGRR